MRGLCLGIHLNHAAFENVPLCNLKCFFWWKCGYMGYNFYTDAKPENYTILQLDAICLRYFKHPTQLNTGDNSAGNYLFSSTCCYRSVLCVVSVLSVWVCLLSRVSPICCRAAFMFSNPFKKDALDPGVYG